ncbi:helix-turn-helix transcriptional regulator [Plantactinospora solaniradicis]|uniref:Helix-turn-helix transcriptional regulator n=1 Tax=Plantactinospora solaniradicis TaxID=1723736 RepID=A0ABW1KKF6_9ACTN
MKRRKVSNMLGLAVLATVVVEPMHPYEMATVMRERGKDRDMPIKWGTLYTVVQNLEKHGFLEVVESGRQGGRPERTVYRITPAGRDELRDWVGELIAVPEPEQPRFRAALSLMGVLRPDETTHLLRQRVAVLERHLADDRAALDGYREKVHSLFLIEAEYDLAMRQADLEWTRELLAQLSEGTLPGQDLWRRFHETGEIPPEVAFG